MKNLLKLLHIVHKINEKKNVCDKKKEKQAYISYNFTNQCEECLFLLKLKKKQISNLQL